MRFWIPLLIAAAIAGAFWLAVADSAPPKPAPQTQVNRLERKVKRLNADVLSLTAQVHQLQADELTAAEAEDGLRVRIEKLEQQVFGH